MDHPRANGPRYFGTSFRRRTTSGERGKCKNMLYNLYLFYTSVDLMFCKRVLLITINWNKLMHNYVSDLPKVDGSGVDTPTAHDNDNEVSIKPEEGNVSELQARLKEMEEQNQLINDEFAKLLREKEVCETQ